VGKSEGANVDLLEELVLLTCNSLNPLLSGWLYVKMQFVLMHFLQNLPVCRTPYWEKMEDSILGARYVAIQP
jgi:hypothetical protein